MLTTKNWRAVVVLPAQAVFLAILLAGCTPPGPRALLKGERLLREGKYSQAVAPLQKATQLLPANAQAWNHLGLAYHHAGQLNAARQAYEQARRCDPNLNVVRYNLGCLLLEQNQPQAAVAELTGYTVLQSDSLEAWLKLGTAQLRARQLDGAERSFQTALRLQPGLPEAWNGLGMIQAQRKRPKEALNSFSTALQKRPPYAPALLNLAILHQFYLNDRAQALQLYEQYLELNPPPPDSNAVQELVRQLRAELAPPVRREMTNALASLSGARSPATNPPSSTRLSTNTSPARPLPEMPVAMTPPVVAANHPKSALTNLAASAEPPPAPRTKIVDTPRRVETPSHKDDLVQATASQPAVTAPAPAVTSPTTAPQVVQLTDEPPPKLAQDGTSGSPAPAPAQPASPTQVEQARLLLARKADNSPAEPPPVQKKRVLDRLNPATWFRGKHRGPVSNPTPLEPVGAPTTVSSLASPSPTPPTQSEPARAVVPRSPDRQYAYQSPVKPAPGDRLAAEPIFARAVQLHRDGRLSEAIENYRQATKLDPAFFEAHYNLGLAAYELREGPLSLSAYETALSLNSTSANARYNFALALEQGGYFQDAAKQLEKLVEQHPDETRAHFSLASLYADHLGRPEAARPHYQRVLELAPQHPQAAAIRYWLAANP